MVLTVLETSIKKAIAIITIVKQCGIIGSLIELSSTKKKLNAKINNRAFLKFMEVQVLLLLKK